MGVREDRTRAIIDTRRAVRELFPEAAERMLQLTGLREPPTIEYRCPKCGGTSIQWEAWVDPNTGETVDGIDSSSSPNWCEDCKDHPRTFCEIVEAEGGAPLCNEHSEASLDDACPGRWSFCPQCNGTGRATDLHGIERDCWVCSSLTADGGRVFWGCYDCVRYGVHLEWLEVATTVRCRDRKACADAQEAAERLHRDAWGIATGQQPPDSGAVHYCRCAVSLDECPVHQTICNGCGEPIPTPEIAVSVEFCQEDPDRVVCADCYEQDAEAQAVINGTDWQNSICLVVRCQVAVSSGGSCGLCADHHLQVFGS